MDLGSYLFRRLREAGVACTFGLPGDFALPLYALQEKAGLRTVVCTHEPSAAFAADAYARLRGLGVALTTFGAGALNMVNAVAMSFAEHTPVLVISGAPEIARRGPEVYIHHRVKRFDSQLQIYKEITVDAAAIEDPATAADQIERVIAAVLEHKRPGYIEIPRDLTRASLPSKRRVAKRSGTRREFNEAALDEAVREITHALDAARRPVLYTGVGVRRYGLTKVAVRLAERRGLLVVSSVMGKASFPESHPHFAGVYMGALGDPVTRQVIEGSDCVLSVGVIGSDVNTGFWTSTLDREKQIEIGENDTRVGYHHYDELPLAAVLTQLAEAPSAPPRTVSLPRPTPLPRDHGNGAPLRTAEIIRALRRLDQSRYSFLADVGDAWFIGLELRADIFLAPGYYATMGFAVPGALGAGLAEPRRRPFVLVGDGAFQMTGAELATLAQQKLRPIILLLNNACYMMLEALDGPRAYYQRKPWDYAGFARSVGGRGERVTTREELLAALRKAEAAPGPYLIEAVVDKNDPSPVMRRIQAHFAAHPEHIPSAASPHRVCLP